MNNVVSEDLYRIGTVAALTGVAVERLRAWERRYDFKPTYKNGKTRFYSKEQLSRLKKIKQLTDLGYTISRLITLTDAELQEKLSSETTIGDQPAIEKKTGRRPKVCLIGASLLSQEQTETVSDRIEITARWANIESFSTSHDEAMTTDIIVALVPVLIPHVIESIENKSPSSQLIALYQFATAEQISYFEQKPTVVLNWPVSWQQIEYQCANLFGLPKLHGDMHPRHFSDEELIAMSVSDHSNEGAIKQLVNEINQLNALAQYLTSCSEGAIGSQQLEYSRTLAQAARDVGQARGQLELASQTLSDFGLKTDIQPSDPNNPNI